MPDTVRIPLSPFQQSRFAAMQADVVAASRRRDDAVTTIIAGTLDPATLGDWSIALEADAIVCTPPAPKAEQPEPPAPE